MNPSVRRPAFLAPQPPPAAPINDDPASRLEALYLHIWANSMHDLPFVNTALSVEAVGFRRWQAISPAAQDAPFLEAAGPTSNANAVAGDWVGAVITPWFINLFVLPGGGNLWSDRRSGERCHITFPIGPLEFIADYNASAVVPAYQYCPLFAPPSQIASQTAARAAALAALDAMLSPPSAAEGEPRQRRAAAADLSRRAFFRRVIRH